MLGTLPTKGGEEHKILGVPWNPSSDCLIFNISEFAQVANNLQPTKRSLVGLVGKFYDPLVFLPPTTIRFKILFQKLCQAKIERDDHLPEGLVQEWKELVADLSEGGPTSIPRSYFIHIGGTTVSTVLCGFCDASMRAYAAVVLRTNTDMTVRFVVAKTRVAFSLSPLQAHIVSCQQS